jgi:hypothetical protein
MNTELNWAQSESSIGQSAEAQRHLDNAQRDAESVPSGGPAEVLKQQMRQARSTLNNAGKVINGPDAAGLLSLPTKQ